MSSLLMNPIDPDHDFIQRTEWIYIDPQELIALKSKRKSFKMVKSIYEPSQQDYEFIDRNQLDKFTKCSSNKEFHKRTQSSPKILSHRFSHINNLLPHQQKIQSLQEIIQNEKVSPNVQFIWKLLPSSIKKQIISYQQGDCIPFQSPKTKQDDKYLILSGEVRIFGKNNNNFRRKAGYLYFLSKQTKNKIKQMIVLRSTKILKIPQQFYEGIIKPYLRLKYSQRLNFLHICPFFIWNQQLSQDLAGCMQLILNQKQETIYQVNQYADKIFFVKEGIVLLERNTELRNPLIEGYQQHYQKNQFTQKDVILVVRKGMVFGVDGVIIKQFVQSSQTIKQTQKNNEDKNEGINQNNNKEGTDLILKNSQFNKTSVIKQRSNQRIYTARTLGKCELYCLDKKVLETLFMMNDISQNFLVKKNKISIQQLQRLSLEYTTMLARDGNIAINKMPLKRKEIVLNIQNAIQQRSKSLVSMKQKSSSLIKNNKKQNQSPLKKPSHKKIFFQNQKLFQKMKGQQELKKINPNDQKQINQLRNKIRSYRQKLKLSFIKRSTQQKQINSNQIDSTDENLLPKIIFKNQKKIDSNQKQNQLQKSIKLNSIINKKLKQDLELYKKQSPKLQKKQSIKISIDKKKEKPQLVKLLEQQNIKNKSNPSFFNLKSYKSMGSVISSVIKT